jgi:hypothetical protein
VKGEFYRTNWVLANADILPIMSANPRCLFTVTNTFLIQGRGIVLMPGIIPQRDERFRVGDFVELRRPDNSIVRVQIAGIEIMNPMPRDGSRMVLIKKPERKEDVPIGTEVWSIEG